MHPKRPVEPDRPTTAHLLSFRRPRSGFRANGSNFVRNEDPDPPTTPDLVTRTRIRDIGALASRHFRGLIVFLSLLLFAATALLTIRSLRLETLLEHERNRVAALEARLLDQDQQADDSESQRQRLAQAISSARARLDDVEARFESRRKVIAGAARATILLRGTYGFVDPESGQALRYLSIDASGEPVRGPDGEPLLSLEGEAPKIEYPFSGTAFAVSDDGHLITNRHVARPWELDPQSARWMARGLAPKIMKFVAYTAGEAHSVPVIALRASQQADVALLQSKDLAGRVPALRLGTDSPHPGDEVLLLGYPAGLRGLLARSDEAFVTQLLSAGPSDDRIAQILAERGSIRPLATRGIVGQVGDHLVYDAESTSGGSGGPVLNLRGEVVAVHTSILPEFGGSNMGVPVALALALLGDIENSGAHPAKMDVPSQKTLLPEPTTLPEITVWPEITARLSEFTVGH